MLRVQMGNGQCVAVLFVIPVVIDVYDQGFEVFTLVSEIHDNVDLVLGMKNVFELECVIDTQDSSFKLLNRSISGIAIVKLLDSREQCAVVLKLKFIKN